MLVVSHTPDIVIWDKKDMQCRVVEDTVPFDMNLEKSVNET